MIFSVSHKHFRFSLLTLFALIQTVNPSLYRRRWRTCRVVREGGEVVRFGFERFLFLFFLTVEGFPRKLDTQIFFFTTKQCM